MAVKKGANKGKLPTKYDLLTDAVKTALEAEAKKSIAEEMTQQARDEYFQEQIAKARRGHVTEDALVNVTVDIAPFEKCIMLDHVQFFHGYTYEVPQKQAAVLYEQMQRTWHHQDEIDGRGKTEAYRRPQNRTLGPHHAGSVTRGVNGVVAAEL